MDAPANDQPRRCDICGGEPSWVCPDTELILCWACLIRSAIGIDHHIPGTPELCAHRIGSTGKPYTFRYTPAELARQ